MKLSHLIRGALLGLSAVLLTATPSAAQQATQAQQVSPQQVEAARDTLNALMFETGLLDQSINELSATSWPELRQRAASSELRESLSESRRAALDQFVEEAPAIIEGEVRAGAAELIAATSGSIAELFSIEEWQGIAAFLRSTEGRTLFLKLANGDRNSLTADELEFVRRFYESPAGQAFARNGAEMNRRLMSSMEAEMPAVMARMRTRLFARLCESLGDECPTHLQPDANAL